MNDDKKDCDCCGKHFDDDDESHELNDMDEDGNSRSLLVCDQCLEDEEWR